MNIGLRYKFLMGLGLAFTVFAATEIFSRKILGLGTPPLYVVHRTIEYMLKPNQDLYRFGNHVVTNRYGMRSKDFGEKAAPSDGVRIMMFGDSVLNGGSQTDHSDLATSIIEANFNAAGKAVLVGNISAGSWGPGNWLAYATEYGFFDANIIVLVISSHDYMDVPGFGPLNPMTHPVQNPNFAFWEGVARYLPRYLPKFLVSQSEVNTSGGAASESKDAEKNEKEALSDLGSFLRLAKKNSKNVLVFQHWTKSEIERGTADPGNSRIKEVCDLNGISAISLEKYFRDSISNGQNPYRDDIHPNKVGQALMATAIYENLYPIIN